jgi:hypothetical protein
VATTCRHCVAETPELRGFRLALWNPGHPTDLELSEIQRMNCSNRSVRATGGQIARTGVFELRTRAREWHEGSLARTSFLWVTGRHLRGLIMQTGRGLGRRAHELKTNRLQRSDLVAVKLVLLCGKDNRFIGRIVPSESSQFNKWDSAARVPRRMLCGSWRLVGLYGGSRRFRENKSWCRINDVE